MTNVVKKLKESKRSLELHLEILRAEEQELTAKIIAHPNWREDAVEPFRREQMLIKLKIRNTMNQIANLDRDIEKWNKLEHNSIVRMPVNVAFGRN